MNRNRKIIQYINTLVIIIFATLIFVGCPDKKATQSFIEKNYEFADLKIFLKGKSCFNINKTTPHLLREIEEILKMGIDKYKEIDWI